MAAQHNKRSSAVPLTSIATVKQQINHPGSPVTIKFDVHNTYIDAEQVAYEEVASVISNKDDRNMLCLTFRVWFIGLLFVALQASIKQYFWYRTHNEYNLAWGLVILLSFLVGKLFALVLPTKYWSIGSRYRFSLNPGPFTFKEHILIFVMNSASSYGVNLATPLDLQRIYYNKPVNYFTGIGFCASLYLMVFGIAGIMRRFLVWPSALLWPENLPTIILIRTLNDQLVDGSPIAASNSLREISRLKFFIIVMICQCVYFWIPNYFMQILLAFAWLCWINTSNRTLSQLTGMDGFGIGSLQFNWSSIVRFWNSPIIVPFWAKINMLIGFVLIVWILSPLCFYTNFRELGSSAIRPVLPSEELDRKMNDYIERLIVTLNETQSKSYSELYKSYFEKYFMDRSTLSHVLYIGSGFLLATSLIVHTILYHGHEILKQARTSVSNRNNDIHCFLMAQYPETPEWWFTIVFVVSLTSGILVCHYEKLMEWHHMLLGVAVGWALILPCGIIRANTGLPGSQYLKLFHVGAFIFHKKPMSILTFGLYVPYLQTDTLSLVSNLKLCHYAKIPPRNVFITLVVGRLVAAVVGYVVGNFLLTNVHEMCHTNNVDWSCPKTYNDIAEADSCGNKGPKIWLSDIYKPLLWLLLIGAILPFPFWFLHKKYSNITWLKYVHIPIMLMPAVYWESTSSAETFTWLLFGFLCHSLIRRWWYDRYSLLFSIAMDTGATISGTIIFFIFSNGHFQFPEWWGTRTDGKCPLASWPWSN